MPKLSAQIIQYNFRLHRYFQSIPVNFNRNALADLITQSADLHGQIDEIYQKAVTLLGENDVDDENKRWSFDAIYNNYDCAY